MSSATAVTRLQVPRDFAKPSGTYRLRVWLAMAGLIAFVLVYFGLAGWFTWIAYRMLVGAFNGGSGAVAAFFSALPAAFLAVFMWKAVFFVRHGADAPGLEIAPRDQPELFEFLHTLADEVGAPRPHRVFLSPAVNASVFYNLTILNLLWPSKKNLTIGLGLVNVMTRSEFKAVLAHEFGHFAQRSMAVGRWVYVGEQIAGYIISGRDALDRMLDFISHIDLRVAWIGWIMRTIVWSIRSLMDTIFRGVVLAHRALSREMELQADLVAVSVAGSDALVDALYRLEPADEDWQRSLDFANDMFRRNFSLTDLFAIQTRITELMRRVLNNPSHGRVPPLGHEDPASRRLFTEQLAQPPRMWSTHPSNTIRESNAKRIYIPAPRDEESAWTLFDRPQDLREQATQKIYKSLDLKEIPAALPTSAALKLLDEQYSQELYDTRYRGAYFNRLITIRESNVDRLYGTPPETSELSDALECLYPESLQELVTDWRNLEEEIALLEAIENGIYESPDGVIRHRGQPIPKTRLPELIAGVKLERDEFLEAIEAHDSECRTVHDAIADEVGAGWPDYLRDLTKLLHFVEHAEEDISDAYGHMMNIMSMTVAAGPVGEDKLRTILNAANELHTAMFKHDAAARIVQLPEAVARDLLQEQSSIDLAQMELPRADQQNVNEWFQAVESWAMPMIHMFGKLRTPILSELLRSERRVARMYLGEEPVENAPNRGIAPPDYPTRPRGSERKRLKTLDWWSRFRLADGLGPAIMRFAVAFSIVAAVVVVGYYAGSADVTVYNGLSIPVQVTADGNTITVSPNKHQSVSLRTGPTYRIVARTTDGREIESFDERIDKAFADYVYNIAGAAPLIEVTAVYGNALPRDPKYLGFPRWSTTSANHIFTDPPESISTKSGGATRLVLVSDSDVMPQGAISVAATPEERDQVIRTHARWDSSEVPNLHIWLALASELDGFDQILAARLADNPRDIPTLRYEQESVSAERKASVLARHRQLAAETPDNPDLQYIGIRAMPSGPEQDEAFLKVYARWPDNPWLSNAVGYLHATHADWDRALKSYGPAIREFGPWYDGAAIQVARIRRLLAKGGDADLTDLQRSQSLMQLLSLETGAGIEGGPAFAYCLLHQGNLEHAYRTAGGFNSSDPAILILLAASRRSPDEWRKHVLTLPIESVQNPMYVLYLAAIAHQQGKPTESYLAAAEKLVPEDERAIITIVRRLLTDGNPGDSFDAQLDNLHPTNRGLAYAIAVMLFPDEAPESWPQSARGLLFSVERPAL